MNYACLIKGSSRLEAELELQVLACTINEPSSDTTMLGSFAPLLPQLYSWTPDCDTYTKRKKDHVKLLGSLD